MRKSLTDELYLGRIASGVYTVGGTQAGAVQLVPAAAAEHARVRPLPFLCPPSTPQLTH